jgi:hypothetical protein
VACALLTACWLAAVLLVDVRGDFYLNDDWAYARMVLAWREGQGYQPSTWTYAPAISHLGLGAVFAAVFGYSPLVLRCSVLFASWLGVIGMYVLARSLGLRTKDGVLAALGLAFNPVYFNLACTFMTDAPFAAEFVWALVGVVWFSKGQRARGALVTAACALLAVVCRQPAVALFVGAGAAALLTRVRSQRSLWWAAGLTLLGLAVLALVLKVALPGRFNVIGLLGDSLHDNPLRRARNNCAVVLIYLGIYSAPLLASALGRWLRWDRLWTLLLAFVAASALFFAARSGKPAPFGKNVLGREGLGPSTLHGSSEAPVLPQWLWWGVAAVGAVVSAALLVALLRELKRRGWQEIIRDVPLTMALVTSLAYVLPITPKGAIFDRYFLVLVPAVLVIAVASARKDDPKPGDGPWGYVVIALCAFFSVVATRDDLEHHRLRQALIDEALSRAPTDQIEGGTEFDGWFNYDLSNHRDVKGFGGRAIQIGTAPPGSWPYPDRFLVSASSKVEGYEERASASRRRLMPWGTETLRLYERLPAGP